MKLKIIVYVGLGVGLLGRPEVFGGDRAPGADVLSTGLSPGLEKLSLLERRAEKNGNPKGEKYNLAPEQIVPFRLLLPLLRSQSTKVGGCRILTPSYPKNRHLLSLEVFL